MTAPPLVTARRRTLRAIALFEAAKVLAALAAVIGLLDVLRHYNLHHLALALLWRFHLNPQRHYPALLLHYADLLSVINVRTLAPLAIGYISLRLLESYGLQKEKTWAEWLGALSGALYLPLEAGHLMHRTSLINGAVLLANLAVVGFLALQLWQRRNIKKCEVCR